MSELTLHVGGRTYPASCADGEEDHVRRLASIVDAKIAGLGAAVPSGDPQGLLFAALILADEAEEAKRTAAPSGEGDLDLRELDRLAERVEEIARQLEQIDRSA